MESLTRGQKLVLGLCVVALLLTFWVSGGRGVDTGSGEGDEDAVSYQAPREQPVPIVVHVVGEVQRPGVYQLPAESRVRDAISASGGFTANAREESVNLAAFCEDGQQIKVQARDPARGSTPTEALSPSPPESVSFPVRSVTQQPPHTVRAPSRPGRLDAAEADDVGALRDDDLPEFARGPRRQPVRINSAGLEELQQLPGVGPEIAKRIISHRHTHGPFRSIEELRDVPGIGAVTVENIRISATLN